MLASLRATLRPARARACFSTSRVSSNANEEWPGLRDSGMSKLADMLTKEADSTEPSKNQDDDIGDTDSTQLFNHFHANTFIRPYDLTRKGRSFTQRPPGRRPNVAPATRDARNFDVFHKLDVDPLKLALHPGVLSHFVSEMAMIHPRHQTRLTMKSQRRIAKAIRRSKMIGILPLHSKMYDDGEQF